MFTMLTKPNNQVTRAKKKTNLSIKQREKPLIMSMLTEFFNFLTNIAIMSFSNPPTVLSLHF